MTVTAFNPVMIPPSPVRIAAGRLASDLDLTREELVQLLKLAADVKRRPARYARALASQYISLLFEKPSLRTRMTFELAIKQLGGDAVTHMGPIAAREPVKDVARNLDRWTQAIVARTFSQETIDQLVQWSRVPVVNALSDLYHPCQALADLQSLEEHFGDLRGYTLAFVGDGNNMAHSLMLSATRLGMSFRLATPKGYEANARIAAQAALFADEEGASVFLTNDPAEAVSGAHAVYTDVWASMGQEEEAEDRRRIFAPYQVNETLFAKARYDAVFLHCLPAKRGQEVTDGVVESDRSLVFDQAENRLHAQKALLLMLLA
ncbi:MAG TPA: ornithine carbamoyltransferase [Bryobacteraceae bacterium]|jgi:ornithine carbamoyltransferase|nr:ornithine carbamoyltransferase [Bryobacteraceae bacterium]